METRPVESSLRRVGNSVHLRTASNPSIPKTQAATGPGNSNEAVSTSQLPDGVPNRCRSAARQQAASDQSKGARVGLKLSPQIRTAIAVSKPTTKMTKNKSAIAIRKTAMPT